VRLCLKVYVLTNMPLAEDVLRELESLYNYVNKSELVVSYNRPWLSYLLICDIIKQLLYSLVIIRLRFLAKKVYSNLNYYIIISSATNI
jgi:hypothetical protein